MKNGWLRGVCIRSFVLLAIVVLAGCDGGGDGGGGGVAPTYSISGKVTSNGSGLSGVTLALSGASIATTITDASGNYTFTGLANGNYALTPGRTGFTFSPTSSPQTVSGANNTAVNFTATAVQPVTYSISGKVTLTGAGLPGVTMTLSGASTATTITDAIGNYTFTGLDNGSYTITPGRTGFTFSPTSSPRTVSGADITAVNFTATAGQLGIYSISGHVEDDVSHVGVPDVTIELSDARSATTTTDASGNYTFTGLDNGSYGIEPRKAGYTFSPTGRVLQLSGANATGVNFAAIFTAKIVTCPESGTTNVTIQDFSFTPDNVTISANGIVKWTNNGPSIHTVTAGFVDFPAGSFDSGDLGTGATVCVQFFKTGPHIYYCINHPEMNGNVTVTSDGGDPWGY